MFFGEGRGKKKELLLKKEKERRNSLYYEIELTQSFVTILYIFYYI